jgi:histone acetyltransferase 1
VILHLGYIFILCLVFCIVSSKEEFDAPESFLINPVDLNSYFDDDGKIYGYEGLKVRFILTIIGDFYFIYKFIYKHR